MTKKFRLLLIAVFALIACVCLFAGCNLKDSLQDVLNETNNKGAVVAVTYFANDGRFDSGTKVKTVHYKVGSKAMDIGNISYESGSISIDAPDRHYAFDGWLQAALDENGNPLFEDGTPYIFDYDPKSFTEAGKNVEDTGAKFDFNTTLQKGTHYYLVAAWRKVPYVNVILATQGGDDAVNSLTVTNGEEKPKTYNLGDSINEIVYNSDGNVVQQDQAVSGSVSGATFVGFYTESSCSKESMFTSWPIKLSDHPDLEQPFTLYANYIKGDWTVVKTATDVSNMFSHTGSGYSYYIFDDINCSTVTVSAKTGTEKFNCEIRGNNCTLTGITVKGTLRQNTASASLFGVIGSNAKISNLTLADVKAEYEVRESANVRVGIFFAFTSIEEGASLANITLGGTMTVTDLYTDRYIANMDNGETNHWKFGGYENDSDYSGAITVTNESTLQIVKETTN